MTSGTSQSASASDTTPSSKAKRLSETEFLKHEAESARRAIDATIEQMRETLKDAGDVRAWTKQFPWTAVGLATAAGFLAAAALVPKRRKSDDEDPALLQRILTDEHIAERIKELAEQQPTRRAGSGVVQTVGMSLLRTFGPAIQTAITSALTAKAVAPDAEDIAAAAGGIDPESVA